MNLGVIESYGGRRNYTCACEQDETCIVDKEQEQEAEQYLVTARHVSELGPTIRARVRQAVVSFRVHLDKLPLLS
jgi:hypothetical protein